ncbi:hypothetical protein BH09BAC3_BH09BAC3_12210 [soil metagenome]
MLRHAQSAGKQSGQRDYDRLLTPQGEAEARACGKIFSEANYFPDLILCSAASRTRQTLELFYELNRFPTDKIQFREDIYEAAMTDLLDVINHLPDHINKVLLVGHNPGLSLLAGDLSSNFIDLSTSHLVGYESRSETWKELGGSCKQIFNSK